MAQSSESYGYDQPEDKANLTKPTPPEVYGGDGLPAYTQGPPQAAAQYSGVPPAVQYSQPQVVYPASHQQASSSHTAVVIQQPQSSRPAGPRQWNSTMCACFDDIGICCCGTFCGICLACQVSADMGEQYCLPCVMTSCGGGGVPGYLYALRLKMRMQENIDGSILDDFCSACWCAPCTLCQLAREVQYVKNRRTFMEMPTQY